MRSTPLILVVDDVADNREIVKLRLEANGYEVALAEDGEQALESTRTLLPDLILLDVMMPKLDGIQTVARLKADASLPFIPVILLTAKSESKDIAEGLKAGADEYLSKPIDNVALVARVAAMLRIKELHDRVSNQSEQLARQTQQLQELNADLELRVKQQVDALDRHSRLTRFLPAQVAEALLRSERGERALESHRADITVMFCDLRDFTTFSETSEPEDLMGFLQEYHSVLGNLIVRHEGTLERFSGDAIMVFFNDPTPCPDHCFRATQLAVEIRAEADRLIRKWNSRGARLGLGIGLAAGYATVGCIGYANRLDYAAIGTVTNLASRICGVASAGQILISPRVATELQDRVPTRIIGETPLKGLSKPVILHEVA